MANCQQEKGKAKGVDAPDGTTAREGLAGGSLSSFFSLSSRILDISTSLRTSSSLVALSTLDPRRVSRPIARARRATCRSLQCDIIINPRLPTTIVPERRTAFRCRRSKILVRHLTPFRLIWRPNRTVLASPPAPASSYLSRSRARRDSDDRDDVSISPFHQLWVATASKGNTSLTFTQIPCRVLFQRGEPWETATQSHTPLVASINLNQAAPTGDISSPPPQLPHNASGANHHPRENRHRSWSFGPDRQIRRVDGIHSLYRHSCPLESEKLLPKPAVYDLVIRRLCHIDGPNL